MKLTNLYARLGLNRNATQADIKSAYYKLSKMYHPDKNSGCSNAAIKFRDVAEAYEILGNAKSRKVYDRDSPNDGKVRATVKRPQRSYYQSATEFTERDPDFEEKIRFYRDEFKKKAQRPTNPYGRTRAFDFDAWFNAHYGNASGANTESWHSQRRESQFERLRREQKRREPEPPKSMNDEDYEKFKFEHIYVDPMDYSRRKREIEKINEVLLMIVLAGICTICLVFCINIIERDKEQQLQNNLEKKKKKSKTN